MRVADTGDVLAARPRESILETLERNGYAPNFECRAGACGTCKLRLVAGQVRNGDGSGLTRAERAAGYGLSAPPSRRGRDAGLGGEALPTAAVSSPVWRIARVRTSCALG